MASCGPRRSPGVSGSRRRRVDLIESFKGQAGNPDRATAFINRTPEHWDLDPTGGANYGSISQRIMRREAGWGLHQERGRLRDDGCGIPKTRLASRCSKAIPSILSPVPQGEGKFRLGLWPFLNMISRLFPENLKRRHRPGLFYS